MLQKQGFFSTLFLYRTQVNLISDFDGINVNRNSFYKCKKEREEWLKQAEKIAYEQLAQASKMYDYKTSKVLSGNAHQVNFMSNTARSNPELFKLDLNNVKEIK